MFRPEISQRYEELLKVKEKKNRSTFNNKQNLSVF